MPGNCFLPIFRAKPVNGVVLPGTIADFSTEFSGYCAQGLRGAIFLRTMATGKTRIAAFVAGATREGGKSSWNNWWMTLILNGS